MKLYDFRACFKTLPKIICFNTMRYTFNMVTMMKEKVNTHFSFPMKLNMAAYTEDHLLIKNCDGGCHILIFFCFIKLLVKYSFKIFTVL